MAKIKFRTSRWTEGCRAVSAYDGKKKIGLIGACQSPRYLEVSRIYVDVNYQRQKIGTALYTKMAEIGCSIGKPLASKTEDRSPMADGFWRKQIRKRRAVTTRDATIVYCPVTSLEGRHMRAQRS